MEDCDTATDTSAVEINPVDVRRLAMDLLARREHSFHELEQKLARRFAAPAIISEQLNLLKEDRLQSDERFAESFINGRKSRGKGPMVIRQELKQKGIADELVAMYLDDSPEQWRLIAEQAYQKKFGGKPVADQKDKARRLRFMQYRGFSGDMYRHLF